MLKAMEPLKEDIRKLPQSFCSWGKVDHYEKLFNFRKVFISKPGKAAELVGNNYNVVLQKEEMSDHTITISGQFKSPFVDFLPGLLPEEAEIATFQLVIPKKWKTNIKPVCIHMAGTGDHYFWKRRTFMAKPLAREYGIGSIILENPYYGSRKPKYQTRSCLHNVSDIFVMGGCLALEAAVLLNWCKTQGFGPLGLSGISMGGYMASIAAGAWPEPVVLVPCLSWTTASTVFTKGVMSSAINWKLLDTQYKSVSDYREKFLSLLKSPEDASEKVNYFIRLLSNLMFKPYTVSYAPIVPTLNVTNGKNTYPSKIVKNPERDFSFFLRDWYHRGLKLFWEEDPEILYMRIFMCFFSELSELSSRYGTYKVDIRTMERDAATRRHGCPNLADIGVNKFVKYINFEITWNSNNYIGQSQNKHHLSYIMA
nr:EOG090X08BF [Artemia franciscana]